MGENEGFVVTGWYEAFDNKTTAKYFVRFNDGTKKVFSLVRKPYFYVLKDAKIPVGMNVEVSQGDFKSIDGKELKKLETTYPYDVKSLRTEFKETYEADIPFVDRIRFDEGIKGWVDEEFKPIDKMDTPKLRTLFLDIEVDDSNGFPTPANANSEVLCITIYDNFTDTYTVFTTEKQPKLENVIQCKSEKDLYVKFVSKLKSIDPDIITGWYVGNFDLEYLRNRFGINLRTAVVLDLLECYMKLHENDVRSYALDYIANLELGMGKKKRGRIFEEYEKGLLSEYCFHDVKLCVELDKKLKLIDFILGVSAMSGCKIEDCLFNSRIVDAFMFFELKGKYIQKTKLSDVDDNNVELTGAVVIDPKPGLYSYVAEIDNTAEYPNIMLSWGLSPDCTGAFPNAIKKLMELRDKYKKLYKNTGDKIYNDKQRVVKFIINSFAGVLGYKKYRNYSPDIFNKITELARKHLVWNAEFFKNKGFDVLYGDTDSVYVHIKDESVDVNKLVEELNETFVDFYKKEGGAGNCYLSTKLENIYKKILFMPVKKKYAGITVDGKLKIRGFEVRRSNVAIATSKIQEKVLAWVLDGYSVSEIKKMVKAEIIGYDLLDFGIPCALRKDKYEVQSQHVKAAMWSNENLGKNYRSGDKFIMFFVKKIEGTDVIAVDYSDEDLITKYRKNIDMKRQLERTVVSPLKQIFDVLDKEKGLEVFCGAI